MSEKLLITTSLKKSWDEKKEMVFLGQWCQKFSNFKDLDKSKYEIFHYHWNDRKKLLEDYNYINKVYKKILLNFKSILNEYHSVNYSERYWTIIIGPWLITFLQVAFERYSNLNLFFKEKKNENYETIILKIKKDEFISKNYEEFTRYIQTDTWNHYLYSLMLDYSEFNFNVKKEYIEFIDNENYKNFRKSKSLKNKIYNYLVGSFEKFFSKQDILISESYLGPKDEFNLALNYLSLPRYSLGDLNNSNEFNDSRFDIKLNFNTENFFENFVKKNILSFMPISFLEDFNSIGIKTKKMKWAKKPKIIFTSHFMPKTLQSRYTADCIEKNDTKLIVGQHGGVYGQYLFSTMEDFELNVCDKFLSWGWKNNSNKVIPFGVIKNIKEANYNPNNKNLLMILRSQTRYTHRLNSYSGSSQIKSYYEENVKLCKRLNQKIVENDLLLRFHSRKFGWDEEKLFQRNFDKVNIDMGYEKIANLLYSAKLVLQTYIGTGYLETLASNIPTIVYANIDECLLNEETINNLNILKEANIYHDNYNSAADFINQNWDKISSWWFSDLTQSARKSFCLKYSKINLNKVDDLKKIFNSFNNNQV